MKVIIYTDGSARSNPGRGGYGAVPGTPTPPARPSPPSFRVATPRPLTTAWSSWRSSWRSIRLNRPCEVEVHSDSQYVVNAFNKHWIDGWKKRGWKTANKQPVKNRDLWERLLAAKSKHKVEFIC